MKAYILFVVVLFSTVLFAEPRGLTSREIIVEDAVSCVQPLVAPTQLPEPHPTVDATDFNRESWFPQDMFSSSVVLPAGEQMGLRYSNLQEEGVPFYSMGELAPQAQSACNRVPGWLSDLLLNTMLHLQSDRQLLFADLLATAPLQYVDEIAFCIATSSPEYLNSEYCLPQLYLENAQQIYAIAAELPYVEILEVTNEPGGAYSTTRYWKKDASGQMQQLTVPRDVYYWYLVQPKITDEIAAYIDPAIVENNGTHANNIVAPPTGKFWRSYFYDYEEDGYPVLCDTLLLCQSVFNRDGSPGDVIHALTWWINQNMSFTSNSERPHQPVRIFEKRFGRCGEYADFSAAVARTALIPCTNISSISTDHTWNEFWEDGWVSWEPVNGYLNGPLVYENGWGKVFGSVFQERCDGLFTPVTQDYSEGLATINIQVVDENMYPVDGARVVLAIVETTPRFDCVRYTDNSGMVSFPVGENREYRARAEASFGIYPEIAGTYAQLVNPSVSGEIYNYQFVIPAEMPLPAIEELPNPVDPEIDLRFNSAYTTLGYYIVGRALWDDIDVLGSLPQYYCKMSAPSNAVYMVTDADNLLFLQLDNFASVYGYVPPAHSGEGIFDIPVGQDWYSFIDNSHRHGNAVIALGVFDLERWGSEADDPQAVPPALVLSRAYPNPARENVMWKLDTEKSSQLQIAIYNSKGQKVRTLGVEKVAAGSHEIGWDGKNDAGNEVSSGLYILKASTEDCSALGKVIILR